jgi:tape measure domain-containing protein
MGQIRQFGAQTPFETADIAKSAKALLNVGVASDDVISQLKVVGNMAALAGTNVSDLATIFSQVRSKGVLTGERLLQFQERLVPVTAAVAQHFGILESEVNDFVSQGKVGYDDLVTALNNVEINGNRLDNMMERQSQTAAGLWSTVKDGINQALAELGKFILEQLKVKEAMQGFASFMTGTFIPIFKAISTNWQSLWDLMVSHAALQLVRIMEDVKHFGVQVASVAEFIWKSMVGAFETIGDDNVRKHCRRKL